MDEFISFRLMELTEISNFMQRKVFWISFLLLGLMSDLILPFLWAVAATVPLIFFCWWLAYRSDWFE